MYPAGFGSQDGHQSGTGTDRSHLSHPSSRDRKIVRVHCSNSNKNIRMRKRMRTGRMKATEKKNKNKNNKHARAQRPQWLARSLANSPGPLAHFLQYMPAPGKPHASAIWVGTRVYIESTSLHMSSLFPLSSPSPRLVVASSTSIGKR